MAEYRRSYQKTTVAASLAAVGALGGLAWLLGAAAQGRRAWPVETWVAWGGLAAILVVAAKVMALVALGGLTALRRDLLEARGVPYARARGREWLPGPLVQATRRALRRIAPPGRRRPRRLALRPGEVVEVRGIEEILATLDERGALDALPFMPEMSAFCGRRFRVHRRVDKLNDWVTRTGLRRLHDTVLLELVRCDGSGHGGCQASCHIRWKEAWLRRASDDPVSARAATPVAGGTRLGEADLSRLASRDEAGETRYTCQATELAAGTTPLHWGDPRHYLRDVLRGNIRPLPLVTGVSIALFNWVQRRRRGVTFPLRVTSGGTTSPTEALNLQPGESIRVKTKAEIALTLNERNRNRGLWFDVEMLRFCGGRYRVEARAERLIEEQSGRLLTVGNPCIILEGVTASGEYLGFCAQNEAILWREIWLARSGPQA
jgi:hypothetical protein